MRSSNGGRRGRRKSVPPQPGSPGEALQRAIDCVGGFGADLARALGYGGTMMVSQWRRRGVPPNRCVDIERVTGGMVTRAELRPDIFGAVAEGQKE